MVDRLSEFGYSFQIKLLSALFSDRNFLVQILDILETDYFESEANRGIFKIIKHYFQSYNQIPTLEVLKVRFADIDSDVLKTSMIEHLKDVWKNLESNDLAFVKEETLRFCKNQKLKSAILDSVELLKAQDYDGIKEKIDTAIKAGQPLTFGLDYSTEVERRYTTAMRKTIPTGWSVINELMDGGLAPGELGVIFGSPGSGKSWALINIALDAVKKGKNVVYYTLELDEDYTARRFDSLLTGIPFQNLKYHVDDVKEKVSAMTGGRLNIQYFPEYSITVNGLKSNIERLQLVGQKPDLIVLDYADCLKPIIIGKRDRSDQVSGDIYTMLRGVAGELQLPIWTVSQVGREGESADIIQGRNVSESYIKVMKADFIVSLSRKVEDKIAGTGRWHVIKNRFGADGITFPSKINFSNGSIEIFDNGTVDGREAQEMMNNSNEYARKYLKTKFKELSGNNGSGD